MDKRKVGIIPVFIVIAAVFALLSNDDFTFENTEIISPISTSSNNESIGMVINSPSSSVTLYQLDEIFTDASSSGIGRSNVYLYWNVVEPIHLILPFPSSGLSKLETSSDPPDAEPAPIIVWISSIKSIGFS